jgi:pyridoxine/pyridoxamine 5'-phosphate oxidase
MAVAMVAVTATRNSIRYIYKKRAYNSPLFCIVSQQSQEVTKAAPVKTKAAKVFGLHRQVNPGEGG